MHLYIVYCRDASADIVILDTLAHLWQLTHCTQAACADIHITWGTIDLDATAMHVKHKATARAMLRKWNVIAIHRLALADITTTS